MSFRVQFETKARRDIKKEARYLRREVGAHAELRWHSRVDRFLIQLETDPHR